MEGELTEEFGVKQGLRQGCPLSPWPFNIFVDRVVREAMVNFKGGSEARQLPHTDPVVCERHSSDR